MVTEIGYLAINTAELSWTADPEAPGRQIKLLVDDRAVNIRTMLVKLPPGYREPAHTHSGTHIGIVLEGKQVINGTALGPDDFYYLPSGIEHGPIEYPDGCVLFDTFQSEPDGRRHGTPGGAEVGVLAIKTADLAWVPGELVTKLPSGTFIKKLVEDPARNLRAVIGKLTPGYHEPLHTHGSAAPGTVLSGRQLVIGRTLTRGDFRYSRPWLEHGPFDYPEECVVFGIHQGDLVHNY